MGASDWVTAGAAVVTAVVTGVYAFFTWRLWQETRRQADLTKGLAEATKQQAEVTHRMFEASHRPYVSVDPELVPISDIADISVLLHLHNYGAVQPSLPA